MKFCYLKQHDGPKEYHAWWNKSDRKRQIICYHLYVESKKIKQRYVTKKTHREKTIGYQYGEGRGVEQERGMGLNDKNNYV